MCTLNSAIVIGIILMIAGFTLVGIEMITPGFSIPGITGTVCLAFGVLLMAKTVEQGIILTLIIILILVIMLIITLTLLSKGKISKKLVLTDELNNENGFTSSSDLKYLLGKKGKATTDLRPTGIGDFDGVTYNVLSEGDYIQKGTPIEIIKVEGSKLIVKTE